MAFCSVNPVTLKEMRQSVRGLFINILLVITLVVNGLFICSALIFNEKVGMDFTIARQLFGQIYFMLIAGSFILIPAYLGNRFAGEITNKENSLFFSTAMRPSSIVWGKFFSGAMLVTMFYSSILPFLILLYFLRGLDVVKMLLTIFYSFIFSLLSIMFMLAFNSDASHPGIRRSKNIIGVIFLLFMSSSLGNMYMFIGHSGDSITSMFYWARMLTYLVLELLAGGFLFTITVYRISPKLSNRALPVKIYMAIFWLVTGIIALAWSLSDIFAGPQYEFDPLKLWLVSMIIISIAAMIMSASEPNTLSERVCKGISTNPAVRLFQYLFFSGCANTFLFCTVTAVLTLIASTIFEISGVGSLSAMQTITLTAAVLYGLMYGLTTITIKRRFFKNKSDTKIPIMITAILVFTGVVTPVLIAFYLYDSINAANGLGWYAVGNPFILFSEKWPIFKVLSFTSTFTVVLAAFNWRWFYESFQNFRQAK